MASIFGLLFTVIVVVAAFYLVCGVLGVTLGIISCVLKTKTFWFAVIGGLIVYALGYHTDQAIRNGLIVGGGLGILGLVCDLMDAPMLITIVGWTVAGVVIGLFFHMAILLGLVGAAIGLYKAL